jgi:hypothetical protein
MGFMVVDNVHKTQATTTLDMVDFPTILDAVADVPEGGHLSMSPSNMLCKCRISESMRKFPLTGGLLTLRIFGT